jgi:hypothetical protein
MQREDRVRTVQELFDAFGAGGWDDPEFILRNLADTARWWVAGSKAGAFDSNSPDRRAVSGTMSKQQMCEHLRSMPKVTDGGLKIAPIAWTVEGDRVAVEAISEMKLRDGRLYRNQYHFAIQFDGDKIVVIKSYMDTAHVLEIFGG